VESLLESADFDQALASVGWLHVLASGRTLFSVNLNGGHEEDVGERQDGAAWLGGARLFAQTALTDRIGLFGTAGAQYTDYDAFNETFLVRRADTLYDVTIGLNWQFVDRWTVRPQVQYTRNVSNIDLYDFERADFSISLRRDFSWP
jgi:opacity protein-like surface antigen